MEGFLSIRRGPIPADSFTIISNAWLRDPALSWKAKGLLSYIASHAPGHTLTSDQIVAEGMDGRDAVRAGLVELEQRGYLKRVKLRGEGGKITGTDYELGEPDQMAINGKPSAGKPGPGADQQEQHEDAAQASDGFSGAGKAAGKKTTPQKTEKTPSATPRGTRLPEGWEPTDKTLDWCAHELIPGGRWSESSRVFIRREHAKFTDYWTAKAGRDAVKLDWDATWRNWMRRAFERFGGNAPTSGAPVSFAQAGDEYKAKQADFKRRRADLAQQLIDNGMNPVEALRVAGEEVSKRDTAGSGGPLTMETNAGLPYIEGNVIVEAAKEVTGS
jgi:hypothetical protein